MSLPQYSDSKEKLIEDMQATAGSGSIQYDIVKAILDVKTQEAIAGETKNLKRATWGLVIATVCMVIATVVLIFVTASK